MGIWKYIYGLLFLTIFVVWSFVFQIPPENLQIIACDVGQGDAILVIYKDIQILTDGGPDKKVLECLTRHIPLYDREIELVILTHPDADHSTGLVDVIKRYNVDTLLINPIDPGTEVYRALDNAVGSRGVKVIYPHEGMSIRLGLIYLDIYNPNQELNDGLTEKIGESKISIYKPKEKTNDYSIVYRLTFGNFKGLFTGDFEQSVSNRLASENKIGKVNYIKIPHHGSRNGLTENLLKAVEPSTAVISVGAKNRYGHPTPEILKMLSKYGVKIFRTDEIGDVVIETDGTTFTLPN